MCSFQQLLVCDVPFPHLKNEGQVIQALVRRENPRDSEREERMLRRSLLLSFCEECWKERPSMRNLAYGLKRDRDLGYSVELPEPVDKIMDQSIRAIYGKRRIDGEMKRVVVKRFSSVQYFDYSFDDGKLKVSK